MRISSSRTLATLAVTAVIVSDISPAAAFGPRLGGMGRVMGGFGAFHGIHPAFPGFHPGRRFFLGERFHPLNGRFFGAGFILDGPYGPIGPYATPYGLGYGYGPGYTVGVAPAGASSAPSDYARAPEPIANCVAYKLNYDDKGQYQGVTTLHPCE